MKFWKCFDGQGLYFFINFIHNFAFPFHEHCFVDAMLGALCVNTIIEPLNYSRLNFFPWNILVSIYSGSLVSNVPNLLFPSILKSSVTICRLSLSIKPELAQLHRKMVLSWINALTSRLETNLLKLNILDLTVFVREYTTVGSLHLISVGKHAFPDVSWKICGTLLSFASSFRMEILQILVGVLLLTIVGLNIIVSAISRDREYHWKYL